MSSLSLLTCWISTEKQAASLMDFPSYVTVFYLTSFKIFSLLLLFESFDNFTVLCLGETLFCLSLGGSFQASTSGRLPCF